MPSRHTANIAAFLNELKVAGEYDSVDELLRLNGSYSSIVRRWRTSQKTRPPRSLRDFLRSYARRHGFDQTALIERHELKKVDTGVTMPSAPMVMDPAAREEAIPVSRPELDRIFDELKLIRETLQTLAEALRISVLRISGGGWSSDPKATGPMGHGFVI